MSHTWAKICFYINVIIHDIDVKAYFRPCIERSHHGTLNGGERDSWVIACGESEGGNKIDGDDEEGVGIWERTTGSRHLK